MMVLEPLYELDIIADELSRLRMSREQQDRVTKIRYNIGIISGYIDNNGADRDACHRAFVEIRALSKFGYEEGRTRKVRQMFAELLQLVGKLEIWIKHEMKSQGVVEKAKSLVRIVASWVGIF